MSRTGVGEWTRNVKLVNPAHLLAALAPICTALSFAKAANVVAVDRYNIWGVTEGSRGLSR